MQAVHDLLTFRADISKFDHLQFPGVVPRTFVGPLALAAIVSPFSFAASICPEFLRTLMYPEPGLLLTRLALGIACVWSLSVLREAIAARFTRSTSIFFSVILMSQFHLLYYASRALPNIFALVFVNIALAEWIHPRGNFARTGFLLSFACAMFRSELCILISTTFAVWLFTSRSGSIRYRMQKVVPHFVASGIIGAVLAASVSILVDSLFWRRLSYPELEVFYYNVILNKSSAWGTAPWHWYFSTALPKALGGGFPLALLGFWQYPSDVGPVVAPAILFVAIYSWLPHKELRFVFYAIPSLNIAAASGLDFLYRQVRRNKGDGRYYSFRIIFGAICVAISFAMTILSLAASTQNYPGGHALLALQQLERSRSCLVNPCPEGDYLLLSMLHVHIDADSAMNGVTRFLEIPETQSFSPKRIQIWTYSREEDLSNLQLTNFTHLITARPEVEGFRVIFVQSGYGGISLKHVIPSIRMIPRTYVHRRKGI